MRNLKKILALVLALVMAMSVMATAAFTDAASIDASYDEATQVLAALKVFGGRDDGSFDPKANITREEVAAVMYRVITGKTDASLYVDGAKFDDVASTSWAAGYIGYCANGGIIGGYGDGNFGYGDSITGYQLLAMMLRAIGYGKNGEFVGANWEKNVASVAQDAGMLDTLKNVQLSKAISREVVAEIVFQGLMVPQVVYTPAFGYQPVTSLLGTTETIGQEVFKLSDAETLNKWGQPGTTWTYTVAGVAGTLFVKDAATATYVTAATECQVASDTKQAIGTKPYTAYTNGVANVTYPEIVATDIYGTIGAQGQLTEVYAAKGIIVHIDTLLAKVTKVTALTKDAAGHLSAPATISLAIYDGADSDGTAVTLSSTTANYTYTAGQYILVNALQAGTTVINDTATQLVVLKGVAETLTGAQTFVHWYADKHTVNGVEYFDNNRFYLDAAQLTLNTNYTWYKDANGNLLGNTVIETPKAYAIVEGAQWLNTWGANGYAQANIRYMDNTTATVIVKSIYDAIDDTTATTMFYADYTDLNLAGGTDFLSGKVSTVWQYNDDCMDHLFEVITNTDGTVTLRAQKHLTAADIADGVAIVSGNEGTIYVDNYTTFLIQTQNPTTYAYTYSMVTGYDNLEKSWTVDAGVAVDYVDYNPANGYAKFVYITGKADTAAGATAYNYAYFTSNTAYYGDALQNNVPCYVIGGTAGVDGQPTLLYVSKTVAQADVMAFLASAKDKLYEVETTGGVVTALNKIVEIATNGSEDADSYSTHKTYVEYVLPGTFDTIDGNGVLKTYTSTAKTTVAEAFNTNASTTIINMGGKGTVVDLTNAVLTGKAIYVVTTATALGANTDYVKAIFITSTDALAAAKTAAVAELKAFVKEIAESTTGSHKDVTAEDLATVLAAEIVKINAVTTEAAAATALTAAKDAVWAKANEKQAEYDQAAADAAQDAADAQALAANKALIDAIVLPTAVTCNTTAAAADVIAAVEAAIVETGVTDTAVMAGAYTQPTVVGDVAVATVTVTLTTGNTATDYTVTKTITITVTLA